MRSQQHIGMRESAVAQHQLVFALGTDIGGEKKTARPILQAEYKAPVIGRPG